MSTCNSPPVTLCAGATAAAAPAVDMVGATTVGATSESRIRAPSPLPNAFLAIEDDLLCKVGIGLRASTMNVVEVDRLTVAWRFCQANIPRYYRLKDLAPKEASKI